MRHESEFPDWTIEVYSGAAANPAHVVAQPAAAGYCVGHSATARSQNPSHGVPHTPAPLGPACTQWVLGSATAALAWYERHASESPACAPAVPAGKCAHDAMHVAALAYCE